MKEEDEDKRPEVQIIFYHHFIAIYISVMLIMLTLIKLGTQGRECWMLDVGMLGC